MIITQTPLRISFFGGGTDFREFFREEEGWVLSSAIDRYIFVIIKERFDRKIRIGYTKTEMVDSVDEIEHELVRECLKKTGITYGVEISTMGDIPSRGSGMGSSSTVTVGLLNAMHHFLGSPQDAETLAREACEVEIDILRKPIGIQDQYIAAYGGQRYLHFAKDDRVLAEPLRLSIASRRKLNDNLMLFFTNVCRRSETILGRQLKNMNGHRVLLQQMKCLAVEARECLEAGDFDHLGSLLHRGWELKKQLASGISNGSIDQIYEAARKAGALGGKITGAGGGGFMLLYCPIEKQDNVRLALRELPELPFRLEKDGTKVIFNYRR